MTSGHKKEVELRPISFQLALPIRQQVLRQGKSIEACFFSGDKAHSTFHLGAFEKEKLIGIVSLMQNRNEGFSEENQMQLRGMAVLPEYRNRNIAKKLLHESERKLKENKSFFLWCNARENAIGFYEKHGFKIFGDKFEIPEIGPHYGMYKQLE
ncbi:MAG TPA: GNAT family N-acetyltransferase [Flavobacteriaceae bacterium]|nr:GNAT family N-acetyltransferase [Flavobacteriaceae bacterium]